MQALFQFAKHLYEKREGSRSGSVPLTSDNRNFARYVKTKTKSRTTVGPLITKDKRVLTEEKDMAEELNKFFSSVFTREDLANIPEPEKEQVQSRMKEIRISKGEIKKKIQKLRKKAAAGPDGIKPRLLQQLKDSILLPLEMLFNRSLEDRRNPTRMENSKSDPHIKRRGQRGPRQLQTSLINQCALQNPGVHRKGQNNGPPDGKQTDPREPTRIHAG